MTWRRTDGADGFFRIRRTSRAKMRCTDCGSRWRIAILEAQQAWRRRVFDLEPGFARARPIGAIDALGDDALTAELAGVRENRGAVAVQVVDELNSGFRPP
jgi:hypothetical protein